MTSSKLSKKQKRLIVITNKAKKPCDPQTPEITAQFFQNLRKTCK